MRMSSVCKCQYEQQYRFYVIVGQIGPCYGIGNSKFNVKTEYLV